MASTQRRAAIVAGLRTPFIKAGTEFARLDVLELARSVTVELLQRTGLDPREIDHVIYGNVTRPVQYTNLARELVLAAGLPKRTPADRPGRSSSSTRTPSRERSSASAIAASTCGLPPAGTTCTSAGATTGGHTSPRSSAYVSARAWLWSMRIFACFVSRSCGCRTLLPPPGRSYANRACSYP